MYIKWFENVVWVALQKFVCFFASYALSKLRMCIVKTLKDAGKNSLTSLHENYKANGWTWNSKKILWLLLAILICGLPILELLHGCSVWYVWVIYSLTTVLDEQTTPIEDLYTMLFWSFVISVGCYYKLIPNWLNLVLPPTMLYSTSF